MILDDVRHRSKRGFVYFIAAPMCHVVKIGFATNLYSRIMAIRTSAPCDVEFLGAIRGTKLDELMWHKRFACLRTLGEWFADAPALRKAIRDVVAEQGVRFPHRAPKADEISAMIESPDYVLPRARRRMNWTGKNGHRKELVKQ